MCACFDSTICSHMFDVNTSVYGQVHNYSRAQCARYVCVCICDARQKFMEIGHRFSIGRVRILHRVSASMSANSAHAARRNSECGMNRLGGCTLFYRNIQRRNFAVRLIVVVLDLLRYAAILVTPPSKFKQRYDDDGVSSPANEVRSFFSI